MIVVSSPARAPSPAARRATWFPITDPTWTGTGKNDLFCCSHNAQRERPIRVRDVHAFVIQPSFDFNRPTSGCTIRNEIHAALNRCHRRGGRPPDTNHSCRWRGDGGSRCGQHCEEREDSAERSRE